MHKSVYASGKICVETAVLFTANNFTKRLCGSIAGLYPRCADVLRAFTTAGFSVFKLFLFSFTHFPQSLLQELRINKLVKVVI